VSALFAYTTGVVYPLPKNPYIAKYILTNLTLEVLKTSLYTFANSVDPDQRAPRGAL